MKDTVNFGVEVTWEDGGFEKLTKFLKDNGIKTVKEQFFEKYCPDLEDIENAIVVLPKNIEVDEILRHQDFIFFDENATEAFVVKDTKKLTDFIKRSNKPTDVNNKIIGGIARIPKSSNHDKPKVLVEGSVYIDDSYIGDIFTKSAKMKP